MSEAQWKARGLDEEANIEEAIAVLRSVVDVFEYFRQPDTQGQLRNTHNKVYVEMDVFQDASNALRSTKGELVPGWKLSNLWQEYVRFVSLSIS